MKHLVCVFSTICQTCKRPIFSGLCLPIGKSAIYGCKECRTQLVRVQFFNDGQTSEVVYLQDTVGDGVGEISILDL